MPICLRLFLHWARAAASRTCWTAGTSRPIRIAMIAITTSSSISVKPGRRRTKERFIEAPTDSATKDGENALAYSTGRPVSRRERRLLEFLIGQVKHFPELQDV